MPATGMGPGSPSGTGGPGSLGGSGQGHTGGAGKGDKTSPTKQTKTAISTKSAGGGSGGAGGGSGGAGEKVNANNISSAPQNNRQTTVAPASAQLSAPLSSNIFPSTPVGGSAPNGSGVIGFPMNGYLSADAQTLDAVELAELLNLADENGIPNFSGDVGADFLDDNITYGDRIKATARNPIVWLAAAGLVGIAAFAIFPIKAA